MKTLVLAVLGASRYINAQVLNNDGKQNLRGSVQQIPLLWATQQHPSLDNSPLSAKNDPLVIHPASGSSKTRLSKSLWSESHIDQRNDFSPNDASTPMTLWGPHNQANSSVHIDNKIPHSASEIKLANSTAALQHKGKDRSNETYLKEQFPEVGSKTFNRSNVSDKLTSGTVRSYATKIDTSTSLEENSKTVSRRRLISYQSSKWEMFWLDRGEDLNDDRSICNVLLHEQMEYIREYLELLCTSRLAPPYSHWCVIDDGYAPLWFNTGAKDILDLTFERPVPLIVEIPPPETLNVGPEHDRILSKFIYLDEATGTKFHEYIEPLVGHLRFPLQKCLHPIPITPQYKNHYTSFRGWIIPPPPIVQGDKALYVDAASSSWESKRGGTSPKFVTDTWERYGILFDNIWVLDKDASEANFRNDVPANMESKTIFHQCALSSSPEAHSQETPFIPTFINEKATPDDYVILKVDLGNVEGRFQHVQYFGSPENRVDELIWEHKPEGLFSDETRNLLDVDLTLSQTYDMILSMRQLGIRTHVWI